MATTIIDPRDGSSYDLSSDGEKWVIRETGTGRRPRGLRTGGPWQTRDQALDALRELCTEKEEVPESAPLK